jgi:TetR/AcrR family transcriptional regulator
MNKFVGQHKGDEQRAKNALLLAGISLFAEKGYASTSVREIVALAGVTKPVLYYYFQSKEGLFRAILDWAADTQEQLLKEASHMDGTFLERIGFLYRRIYEQLEENRDLFRMIHNLIFGPPQGVPNYDMERYHDRMLEAVKAIYKESLEKGEVKKADPDEVAMMIVGVTDYCFHLDYLQTNSLDPERSERLLHLAFQGLSRRNDA